MRCQRTQELIHPYVDGELDLLQAAEVVRHLDHCANCNLTYRNQIALRSSLKDSSLYYRAPQDLKKRIQASLQKEVRPGVTQPAFRRAWLILGISLAVLLIIGALLMRATT